jgi:hypothetical protein
MTSPTKPIPTALNPTSITTTQTSTQTTTINNQNGGKREMGQEDFELLRSDKLAGLFVGY